MREDQVRNSAEKILGFDENEKGVQQGTGQITSFQMLGFDGKQSNHKPDGWYFPDDLNAVAIVLETKSNDKDLLNKQWEEELLKNIRITQTKYKNVVGIL